MITRESLNKQTEHSRRDDVALSHHHRDCVTLYSSDRYASVLVYKDTLMPPCNLLLLPLFPHHQVTPLFQGKE
jgi:hypothetical protein